MIVNKKGRLAIIATTFAVLLQSSSVFAAEGWGQTLGRWGSNVWNTSYPVAAQVGTLAGATVAGALHQNEPTRHIVAASGLIAAPLLALYLRNRQSEEQKNSFASSATRPAHINMLMLAIIGYLESRRTDYCPVLGIIGGAIGGALSPNIAENLYNAYNSYNSDVQD